MRTTWCIITIPYLYFILKKEANAYKMSALAQINGNIRSLYNMSIASVYIKKTIILVYYV